MAAAGMMIPGRRTILGVAVLALSFGCGPSPVTITPVEGFPAAQATAPAPVDLPEDDKPHGSLTEWWYYTGHLQADGDRRYGFEFVIFQSIRGQGPIGYLSHFAITDQQRDSFKYETRAGLGRSIPSSLDLDVAGWQLLGGGGNDRFSASMDSYAVELSVAAEKPAALHLGGIISFGPAGDSYYYSRTRMAVTGRLRDGEAWLDVTGQAWFDHQWGDFVVPSVGGWDWYSFQLDEGSDLMLWVLRDADGTTVGPFGTYVDRSGSPVDVPPDAASIQALGSWASPHTGGVYPSGWRVRLTAGPEIGLPSLDLTAVPVVADQELALPRQPYWEGAVGLEATVNGSPTSGLGYVEMTGYAP